MNSTQPNFQIPTTFHNAYGTFNGNCVISMENIQIAGESSAFYTRSITFDITNDPITHFNSLPAFNYGGVWWS